MMMMNGLSNAEMKDEGVRAATICPSVTLKSSVIRIIKNW